MSLRSLLARFRSDSGGGVAMLVGLSILVLAGALGVVIDSARGYTAKSKLQAAVDAAALAGAKAYSQQQDNASAEARMFFDANYSDDYMGGHVAAFDASVDDVSENMVVQVEVTIPTTFMQLFGVDEFSVTGEAQVAAKQTNLELAVVVDVTGSMNFLDSHGDTRIESLRVAGATLLEAIYGESTSLPGVHVALVPYRAAVNIGASRTGWLRDYDAADFHPHGWQSCVLARQAPKDQDDRPPNGSGNRFDPYLWPAHAYDFWASVYFGPYTPNAVCPTDEIIPLTDQRGTIEAGITALDPKIGGGTLSNTGLVWAWRTLSPRWRGLWGAPTPNDLPQDYDEADLIKAIVFMSDGKTEVSSWEYMAYDFLDEGSLGTTDTQLAADEVDERIATICTSIKGNDIKIYTVIFAETDPDIHDIFRDCASEPENFFFSPTGDELKIAFAKIGRQLATLRLAQ